MTAVQLDGVVKSFGRVEVIKGVDLDIRPNEFVVFVGPSGCGKSTLLRLVAGLGDVTSGTIRIGGEDVTELPPRERGIAMVFQSYALYPHMSVFDNMAFGLKLAKNDPKSIEERVRQAARILQIEHLLDRKPRQLSGGQRQRVAIGRAIVRSPKVFLFDEPLSNLDAALRVQMRVEIAKLHRSLDATMIYVTHDQVEAMTLADRIVVLDAGVVQQFGAPLALYHRPANRFVAGFIGSPRMNFLPAEPSGERDGHLVLRTIGDVRVETRSRAPEAASGRDWVLGARPEDLELVAPGEGSGLSGTVVTVERLGAESFVYLEIGLDEPLVVEAPGGVRAKPDDRFEVRIRPEVTYVFDPSDRCLPREVTGLPAVPQH
jgi:multiple sugar transport system ATP-binding protein